MVNKLSYEYIRGLIDGEGCFTFCTGRSKNIKLPTFSLGLNNADKDLLELVVLTLGLKNKIYSYPPRERGDGYKRHGMSILMVRDLFQLKNVIVPLCYKKLRGYKATQFENWINRIKHDSEVPDSFKLITLLFNRGWYDKGVDGFV